MIVERCEAEMKTIFKGEVCDSDIARLNLDKLDREVLATPNESMADFLQDLEILFRRHAEQVG